MDIVELRPCPFCRSEPDECPQNSERAHPTRKGEWCVYIWCDNCDARGPEKREAADAIAAWNTRATDPLLEETEENVSRVQDASDAWISREQSVAILKSIREAIEKR